MTDTRPQTSSPLDRWEISRVLFYPRPDWNGFVDGQGVTSLLIPVDKDVAIGARFHAARPEGATILFFHGNGEIVADYDDMAPLYTERGINFLPVDYRGYGRSTGRPTVTAMMEDCHAILAYTRTWLAEKGYGGPLLVMGRSLGSASALELAAHHPDDLTGLIIESGFAYIGPLLNLMGINMAFVGLSEEDGPRNLEKIRTFSKKPALIIHAEFDQIIPFAEGKALFDACPSPSKRFLKIPGANHNDLFYLGRQAYMEAITWIVGEARTEKAETV